ncbi:MAG: CBS domain-containing protein [Blastochloris sp.]|nr:CBS domain-containing protein [Blastochloris sp.]
MQHARDQIYVIGHINPDTDAVVSAVGYAWLLQQLQPELPVAAARAGQLNPQTTWVFQRLGVEPPLFLADASPRFASVLRRYDTTTPDSPLREAWTIANRTGGVAPVVNADGSPYGLVTVASLFNFLREKIGIHERSGELRVSDLLAHPCREACDTETPRFSASSRIKDVLPRLLREERDEFLIVNDHGAYLGICRQRDALRPVRLRIVMVDHNEAGQALGALDEADVIEVLDHHRLGNPPSIEPIKFTIDTVGSTSTLVFERIEEAGLSAPPEIAGMLLAGMISDTLLFTSPTTTSRERRAAERLGRWAFIGGSPLAGETVESYGQQILAAGVDLSARKAEELVQTDFKRYESNGFSFAVAQIELSNFTQLDERMDELRAALDDLGRANGLDFVVLMATNVVASSSRLLFTSDLPQLDGLPYPRRPDGTRAADGVVSRKKQLLPQLLSALEG